MEELFPKCSFCLSSLLEGQKQNSLCVWGHTGRHTRTHVPWELQYHKWSNLLDLSSGSSGEILTLLFSICWEETFHSWAWLSEKTDSSRTKKPAFWINTDLLIQKATKPPLIWQIHLQCWAMSWKITLHRPVKAPLHDQTQRYKSWQQSMVESYPLTNFFKPSQLLVCVIQVTIVTLSPLWEWLVCKPLGMLLEPLQLWSPNNDNHDPGYVATVVRGVKMCQAQPLHPGQKMLAGAPVGDAQLPTAVTPGLGWGHSNHITCTVEVIQATLDTYFWLVHSLQGVKWPPPSAAQNGKDRNGTASARSTADHIFSYT